MGDFLRTRKTGSLIAAPNAHARMEKSSVDRSPVLPSPAPIHHSLMGNAVPFVFVSARSTASTPNQYKQVYISKSCSLTSAFIFWISAMDSEDGWSPWSDWTQCTVTCGSGTQQRGRSCDDTSSVCTGPSIQTRRCSLGKCDRRGTENFLFSCRDKLCIAWCMRKFH